MASEAAHYFGITAALPSLCSEPLPARLPPVTLTHPAWLDSVPEVGHCMIQQLFSPDLFLCCSLKWLCTRWGWVRGGGRYEKVLFLFNHTFKPCSADSRLHPLIPGTEVHSLSSVKIRATLLQSSCHDSVYGSGVVLHSRDLHVLWEGA